MNIYFKYDIIIWAVRWYCKYGISYRDLEEMLKEQGIEVDHSTIYRWVQYYVLKILDKLKWYWKPKFDLIVGELTRHILGLKVNGYISKEL